MQSHSNSSTVRKRFLALAMVLLSLSFTCEAQQLEFKNHQVEVKIDKTVIVAPEGSGVRRGMMSMVRHSDCSVYLNTQNKLFKSSDNGQTWTTVPVKFTDVPAGQTHVGIGVTRTGRLLMVHQDSATVGDLYGQSLYVSYSDDGGKIWKKSLTDFTKFSPGIPNMMYHEDGNRNFIEQPDGTLMFTTAIYPSPDYRKKYPPKSPPEPLNYWYGGQVEDIFTDQIFRSTDEGTTWGDRSQVYPYLNIHESNLAIDPYGSQRILSAGRVQTTWSMLGPVDKEAVLEKTGAPDNASYPHKNGILVESTDGGRTFHEIPGGLTAYYEHRANVFWSDNNVVVVTQQRGFGKGKYGYDHTLVARISLDGGKTWVDGGRAGTPLMNQSTKFTLVPNPPGHSFTSPTVEISPDHFLTASCRQFATPQGPEESDRAISCIFWHIERILEK